MSDDHWISRIRAKIVYPPNPKWADQSADLHDRMVSYGHADRNRDGSLTIHAKAAAAGVYNMDAESASEWLEDNKPHNKHTEAALRREQFGGAE